MSIPIDPGFEGFPGAWFYLDRQAQTLTEALPPAATFAAADPVLVSITPRYFNAPPQAFGVKDQARFLGQAKPTAYLKTQLAQQRAGTSTRPLTYAAIYPLVNEPNDDIGNKFFADPDSDAPVAGVPLPGGTGTFRTPVTATVGGPKPHSSLLNIISQIVGIADGPALKALFPIPAADLTLAANVEGLIKSAATAFAPDTKQQYWLDDSPISVAANAAAAQHADSDTLQLAAGTTLFAVFPLGDGSAIVNAVRAITRQPGLTFDMDRGGELIASQNGNVVDPNPFANILYVTYRATVAEPG